MNETLLPANAAEVPWPTSRDQPVRVPNTSMLPGTEKPNPPAADLPSAAGPRAPDGADPLATWVGRVRTTVRGRPWLSLAAAAALGAAIARIAGAGRAS